MGRQTGNKRRVIPFPGRQTVDEKGALNGFIVFACRARPELAREFLDILKAEPNMQIKVRLSLALEIFTMFALQAEDVCQWIVALRDLDVNESLFDAVKNTELNDSERSQIAKWLDKVIAKELLNRLTGTAAWTKQDVKSMKVCQEMLAHGLSEFVKHDANVRPGFPLHVLEATKDGFVALSATNSGVEVVTILTQGAGLRDAEGKEAVFHINDDVTKIEPIVERMEDLAKALSWVLGAVHQSRFKSWPDAAVQRDVVGQ